MPRLVTLGRVALGAHRSAQAKPALLLAYLTLEGPQSRRRLAELFWPDGQGAKSLSMALVRLRTMAPGCVATEGPIVSSLVDCDAVELETALAAGDLEEARSLYGGPFMAGTEVPGVAPEAEEWLLETRERLAAALQTALVVEAEHAAAAGDVAAAGRLAAEAWRLPGVPLAEAGTTGRLAAVLRAAWHPLAREAGAALAELGVRAPAPTVSAGGVTYLGREREHAVINALMERDDVRLVTVLGPGGVGKSRLAEHAVAEAQAWDLFPDGVFLVSLEAVTDPAELPLAVTRALDAGSPRGDAWEHLRAALARRRSLVVLDNMEQLTEAAPRLAEVIAAAERAKLLVTSRVRLGLQAEHVVPLAGLAVPGEDEPWQTAARSPAVRLLLARAGAAGLRELEGDPAAVVRICRAVGGLPLALELAASALRAVPAADLADELEEDPSRLEELTVDGRERHASLARVVAASWRALPGRARAAAARLSVFQGGFTFRAARAVTGVRRDDLSTLVDHGWLVLNQRGRYTFHPHLAAAAAARLARRPELCRVTRARHARWCLELVRTAEPAVGSREGPERLGLGPAEHANLRAALAWAADDDSGLGLELAARLGAYWAMRGMYVEGAAHLERALATEDGDAAMRAKAWVALGNLRTRLHAVRAAREAFERGRELADAVGDDRSLSWAESGLGGIALLYDGERESAQRRFQAAFDAAMRSGDKAYVSDALRMIGHAVIDQGEYARARASLEDALALADQLGDETRAGRAALGLGTVLKYLGENERAHEANVRALSAFEAVGDPYGTAMSLMNLAIDEEVSEERRRIYRRALELFRRIGDAAAAGLVLNNLAGDAQKEGRPQEARELLDESLQVLRRVGDRSLLAHALFIYAKVHLDLGERDAAKRRVDECLEVAGDGVDNWARMRALEVLGRWHAEGGDVARARLALLQARDLAEQAGDTSVLRGVEARLAGLAAEGDPRRRVRRAAGPGTGSSGS